MEQEQLFIETREHAVMALAQRIGGTKKVASMCWPSEDIEVAHKRLLAKLDESRREVLSADDWDLLIRIGAQHECHILHWWASDNNGYQRSQPNEPKDSDDEIAQRIEDATVVLAKALDIYARRQTAKTSKVVK